MISNISKQLAADLEFLSRKHVSFHTIIARILTGIRYFGFSTCQQIGRVIRAIYDVLFLFAFIRQKSCFRPFELR